MREWQRGQNIIKESLVAWLAMPGMKIRLMIGALLVVAALSAWAAIQDHFVGDLFVARAIQGIGADPWEETMEAVSFIGKTLPLVAITLVLFACSLWRHQKAACLATFGALLSFGISPLLKYLIDRPRPTDDLVEVWRYQESLSFPSGHAFNTTILFGMLYYLAPLLVPWKWAVQMVRILSISVIGLTGVSRVYLGAHWPSDVLGGFLYGAIVLVLLISLHRLLTSPKESLQAA